MSANTDLVAALHDEVGEGLRCVARYRRDGYDLQYIRDDVADRYSTEQIDAIHDDVLLQTMNREYFEELFDAGQYQCSALGFEDAMVFQFVEGEFEGLYVSLERDRRSR